jgi:hypothetical protein
MLAIKEQAMKDMNIMQTEIIKSYMTYYITIVTSEREVG